jgi:hypothetical protein
MCFGGGSAGSSTSDGNTGGGSNSVAETIANIFTRNDGASYVSGQLVDDDTGSSIMSGGTTSTGNVISGSANSSRNDVQGPMPAGIGFAGSPVVSAGALPSSSQSNRTFSTDQLGALPTVNSTRENFANLLTMGDGAKYVNGQLIEEATGKSLTGGGTIKNKAGFDDYIYGVSDDFSNNAEPEQGTMSNEDYVAALEMFYNRQDMLEQIPPSDAAYFSSFIPGQIVPVIGEYVGSKMLEGGINERRAMMDQHQAALDAGATPVMQDGVYAGYETDDGVVKYQEDRPVDPMTDSNIGALNMGNDGNNGISATATGQNSAVAQQVFNRYYKGGSGFAMPFWLRKYASGTGIDTLLSKVMKDGQEYYQTPEGGFIPAAELAGAKMIAN